MKILFRLLLLVVLLLGFGFLAQAQNAHVQDCAGTWSAGTTYTTACTGVVSGHILVVAMHLAASDVANIFSGVPTDASGNTYVCPAAAQSTGNSIGIKLTTWLCYAKNVTGGSVTVTTHLTNANVSAATTDVSEFSGADISTPEDQKTAQNQSNPGGSTNAVTSGSVTTAANGEIVFAGSTTVAQTLSEGTGYTHINSGTYFDTEYQIQSTAGAIQGWFTGNDGSGDYFTGVLTLKAAAGSHTMAFSQQPTTTVTSTNFVPTVTVTTSNGASDSITLHISSGSCTLTGTLTRTASSNVATFTALGVGATAATGCVITAHDNTDGTVADITSATFSAIAPAVGCTYTNLGLLDTGINSFINTLNTGLGTGATLKVSWSGTTYSPGTLGAGGSGFAIGDQYVIKGNHAGIGGVTPTNDILVTVTGVSSGAITTFTVSGTAPGGSGGPTANLSMDTTPGGMAVISDNVVICLSAGTSHWNTGVRNGIGTARAIELRGAGTFTSLCLLPDNITPAPKIIGGCGSAGQTIIFVDGPGGVNGFNTTAGYVIVDNIQFVANQGAGNQSAVILGISDSGGGAKPLISHHNDFLITPSNTGFAVFGTTLGSNGNVVYRNRYINKPAFDSINVRYDTTNQNAIKIDMNDIGGSFWASADTFGTHDTGELTNNYIENNLFWDFGVASDRHQSSRSVWRFNEFHNSSLVDHGFDSGGQGDRHSEIYFNWWFCDDAQDTNGAINNRGGTAMVFNNLFPLYVAGAGKCNQDGVTGGTSLRISQFALQIGTTIPGWPGTYPDVYPMPHNTGHGYVTGTQFTSLGNKEGFVTDGIITTPPMGCTGTGWCQDIQPFYYMANTDNTLAGGINVDPIVNGETRVAPRGTTTVANTATCVASQYLSPGQLAIFLVGDLMGGGTPTISDNNGGLSWTPMTGGSQGSARLTGWYATQGSAQTTMLTVTATFPGGASTAARACTLAGVRSSDAAHSASNPAVNVHAGGGSAPVTVSGPSVTANNTDVAITYFISNGPSDTVNNGIPGVRAPGCQGLPCPGTVNDAIQINNTSGNFQEATYCGVAVGTICNTFGPPTLFKLGLFGTVGGSPTANITLGLGYAYPTSTGVITPQFVNSTADRGAVIGTIVFTSNGTSPDLQTTGSSGFLKPNVEYFNQQSSTNSCQTTSTTPFNGTSGTGCGTRAFRPTTCTTGVGYWSVDDSHVWNLTNSGDPVVFMSTNYFNGAMDKCTATNTWTNAAYIPANFPNPLDTVTGSNGMLFSQQPGTIVSGGQFSPTVIISLTSTSVDSITLTPTGCSYTLNGTTTRSSTGGLPNTVTWTLLGASNGTTVNNCTITAHDNTDGTVANIISTTFSVNVGQSMSFSQQPGNIVSGAAFSPIVKLLLTSTTVDSITLSTVAGTCNLTGSLTVSSSGGTPNIATFTGVGANGTPQLNCTLKAHDSTDGTVADVTSTTYNITGVLSFSQQPTSLNSGSLFSPTVVVQLVPGTNDTIALGITGTSCLSSSLTGTTTIAANGSGFASFAGVGAITAGTGCELTATDLTNTSGAVPAIISSTFNIASGHSQSFTSQPINLISGNQFSPVVQVTVVPPAVDTITLSISGTSCPSTLTGVTSTITNGGTGIATWTGLGALTAGTNCTLIAHNVTDNSIADVISNTFNVGAPPAGPVIVTGTVYGATSGYVQFILQPASTSTQFYIAGVATYAPQTTTCAINASGNVVSLFTGPCLVWGNDVVVPANTTYQVVFAPGGTITNRVNRELITGQLYSLNTPVFGPVVTLIPQYTTITTPPIAANLMPSANNTFTIGAQGAQYAAAYISAIFANTVSTTNLNISGTGTFAAIVASTVSAGTLGAQTVTLQNTTITGSLATPYISLPVNATPPSTTPNTTLIYTDNTGTAKICQNGASCVNLIPGTASSPWTRSGTTTFLNNLTDRVLVGSSNIGNFLTPVTFDGAIIGTNYLYITNGTTVNATVGFMGYDPGSLTFKIGTGITGSGTAVPLAFQTASGTLLGSAGKIRGGFIAGDPGTMIIGADTVSGTFIPKFSATDSLESQWTHNGGSLIASTNGNSGTTALAGFLAQNDNAAGLLEMYATSSGYSTVNGIQSAMGVVQTLGNLTNGLMLKSNNTIHVQPGQATDLLTLVVNQATFTQATGSTVFPVVIQGNATTNLSFGLKIAAGTGVGDFPFIVYDHTGSNLLFQTTGDGETSIFAGPSNTTGYALSVSNTNATGTDGGLFVDGGHGGTFAESAVFLSANGVRRMSIRGDGSIVWNAIGSPGASGKNTLCIDTGTGKMFISINGSGCN